MQTTQLSAGGYGAGQRSEIESLKESGFMAFSRKTGFSSGFSSGFLGRGVGDFE